MNLRSGSIVTTFVVITMVFVFAAGGRLSAQPPFQGTVWIEPSIITPDDPTAYLGLSYFGTDERRMFDRRLTNGWKSREAHLFLAKFDDGLEIEVQVNPEFTQQEAESEARRFLPAVGRIPNVLRQDVATIWIHRGDQPFGGGNQNILIHTDSQSYTGKFLEETLCHEATHTSLDGKYAKSEKWLAAQKADNAFISTYAFEYPLREDVAESFLPYLALRYTPDRIPSEIKNKIERTMPNRITFFDSLELDLHPMIDSGRPRGYEWELKDGERLYGRLISLSKEEIELKLDDETRKITVNQLSYRSHNLAKKLNANLTTKSSESNN